VEHKTPLRVLQQSYHVFTLGRSDFVPPTVGELFADRSAERVVLEGGDAAVGIDQLLELTGGRVGVTGDARVGVDHGVSLADGIPGKGDGATIGVGVMQRPFERVLK